ncbi:MAG: hypothetical protein K8S98_07990 [Planctomycetes bacterium]|nr:hypothetical protein [Planctomycetota bacterium]
MRHTVFGSAFVLLFASVAAAQQCGSFSVETFTGGSNVGAWSFGGPSQSIQTNGGFTGAQLVSTGLDTFAPQLATNGASIYTGNYRTAGVTSLAVDLQTYHVDFPSCPRPLSILLTNDNGTPGNPNDDFFVYKVGAESIPCVDGLWHSYHFDVPSASTTLPAGWAVDPNTALAPNVAWNTIMQDVDRVTYFYGDPTFFFIFQMWTIGADNLRISWNGGASTYCISKKNSVGCQPTISSSGQASASQPSGFVVSASQEINNKSGVFFYGHGAQNTPFQGGALCVQLPIQRTPVTNSGGNPPPNDCSGVIGLDFNAWIQTGSDPSLIAGASVFGQCWSRDVASPSGTNLSNAIRFTICP